MGYILKGSNTKKRFVLSPEKEVTGWNYVYMHANTLLTRHDVKLADIGQVLFLHLNVLR